MELKGRNIVIVGSGVSGIGAVELLMGMDANIYLYDGNTKITQEQIKILFIVKDF